MIKDFIDKNRYCFHEKFDSWEDSIVASCEPLVKDGSVDSAYANKIIECVKKYGPYIVIMPNVALPHSMEGADGVNDTAVSFMKVEKPVHFDKKDPEKDAQLFFVLASENHEKHLDNLKRLSEMLLNEELVEDLTKAKSVDDLVLIEKKYY